MASSFPTSLDAFTNPSSTDAMDSVSVPHATQHSDLNDAVEALEAKVGADSSAVTSSHDYKIAQLEAASTGKILQVVSTTKTDAFTASTAGKSWTGTVTGLTATITPSSTSSKVLVKLNITGVSSWVSILPRLTRGGTPIAVGTSVQSRAATSGGSLVYVGAGFDILTATVEYLDSPATTSAITYGVNLYNFDSTTMTLYVNRTATDGNNGNYVRPVSTITVMEVAA